MSINQVITDDLIAYANLSLAKETNFIKQLYSHESFTGRVKDSLLIPLLFSLGWVGDQSSQNMLTKLISSEEATTVASSVFVLGQID